MSNLGQNIIDLGFDPSKFDPSKDHIIEGLKEVKQAALELPAVFKATFDSIVAQSGSNIKAGSAGGFGELKSKIVELQSATDIYNKAVQVTTDRMAAMNGQSKEFTTVLLNEVKATKEASAARLNDAKATTEVTKAKILETKETERSTIAKEKSAVKARELNEPYKQLAIRFAAAANEAKNLAAQYGTHDKRAQEAARSALALNNQLKEIDSSIGNHQREVGNYGKAVEGVGEKLKHLGMEFLSLIGIFSVASFFKDSIDAFLELDKATRLLQNTLRNVGVPELFGRIEESTHKLTQQFKFLREEDLQTVFNKLVVYGKLTENQINELLPVIIDFATATGRDLPEASALIVKAMEGNGKALKEFGINMKDAKTPAEGLSLIMKELAPRVEGVANAFGESAAGKIAASKEEFRKLKEEVGSGLIPVFVTLLGWADKLLTGFGYLGKRIKELGEDILSFGKTASARELAKQLEIETKIAAKFVEEFDGKPIKEVSEAINDLNLKLVDRQRILAAAKANKSGIFTAQDVKDEELRIRIIRQELEGLYKLQDTNKNKILGPGDPNKAFHKEKEKEDKTAENEAKARFEIFKLEAERRADLDMETVKNEKLSYGKRLYALHDYAIAKQSIIEETAKFELTDTKLTSEQIRLVEAKRIDSTLRLLHSLSDAIKTTAKDFKETGHVTDIEVKGMSKSIENMLKDYAEKSKATVKLLEEAKKKEAEVEKKLAEEVGSVVEAIGNSKYEKEKNRIQSLIDKNNEYAQAETDRINNSNLSEQDKAAKLIQLKATTDAKNTEFAKKQKEQDIKKAKFDRDVNVAIIIGRTIADVAHLEGDAAKAVAQGQLLASNPFTIALSPIAFAAAASIQVQAGITAAIGLAQAAKAATAPIPTYAGGTQDHPGGLARYGEAGPEAVILPGGKGFIADKDTTGFLPKHAKVVPLTTNQVNDAMYRAMITGTADRIAFAESVRNGSGHGSGSIDTDKIVEAIQKSNKKVINQVSIKNDFGWIEYINKNIHGK